jgi:hypothetical protein
LVEERRGGLVIDDGGRLLVEKKIWVVRKRKRKLVIDGEDRLLVERGVDKLYFLFF